MTLQFHNPWLDTIFSIAAIKGLSERALRICSTYLLYVSALRICSTYLVFRLQMILSRDNLILVFSKRLSANASDDTDRLWTEDKD